MQRMKDNKNQTKRSRNNDNKAKAEAKLLLAQYTAGLKLRQKGCSKLIEGSEACAFALEGLSKYIDTPIDYT
jgi:hypothetical protein